jgi:hypothetical protein
MEAGIFIAAHHMEQKPQGLCLVYAQAWLQLFPFFSHFCA